MAPWHGTGHPGAAEALGGCPPRGSGRAGGCGSETSPQHPARWRRGCLRRMLPLIISELIGYSIISLAISSRIWEQPVFAAEAALGTGENKLARQSHLPVAFAAWLRRGARLPGGGEGTSPQPPGWHPPALGAHKGKGQSSWGGAAPPWQAQKSPHEVLGEVRGRAQGAKTGKSSGEGGGCLGPPGAGGGHSGAAAAPARPSSPSSATGRELGPAGRRRYVARRVSQHVRGLPLCRPRGCEPRPRGPGPASPCSPPQPPESPGSVPSCGGVHSPPSLCPSPLRTPQGMFRQFLFKIAEGNQHCGGEEKGNGDKLKKKKKKRKTKHNNTNPTGIKTNITGEEGAVPGAGGHVPAPSPVPRQGQVLVAAPLRGAGTVHKRLCSPKCLLLPWCHPTHTSPPQRTRAEGSLS